MTIVVFAGTVTAEDSDLSAAGVGPAIGGVHIVPRIAQRFEHGTGVAIGWRTDDQEWTNIAGELGTVGIFTEETADRENVYDDARIPVKVRTGGHEVTINLCAEFGDLDGKHAVLVVADEVVDVAHLPEPETDDRLDVDLFGVMGPNTVRAVSAPGFHRMRVETRRNHVKAPVPVLPLALLPGERLIVSGPAADLGKLTVDLAPRDDRPYDVQEDLPPLTTGQRQQLIAVFLHEQLTGAGVVLTEDDASLRAHLLLAHGVRLTDALWAAQPELERMHADTIRHTTHRHRNWPTNDGMVV